MTMARGGKHSEGETLLSKALDECKNLGLTKTIDFFPQNVTYLKVITNFMSPRSAFP